MEDAYINIAKEEERLMEELNVARSQQDSKYIDERQALIERHNRENLGTINDSAMD